MKKHLMLFAYADYVTNHQKYVTHPKLLDFGNYIYKCLIPTGLLQLINDVGDNIK